MSETRRYIIILELGDYSVSRLQEFVPALLDAINELSSAPIEQVFRSLSADVMAYAVRTKLHAHQIRIELEAPARSVFKRHREPFLLNSDSLMIMEIGEDHSDGKGFTRFGTWLQHQ
jgi:hypothetical protein